MSYSICLLDPVSKEVLELDSPHLIRDGTYVMGGTSDCRLNVTYNYNQHYCRVLDAAKGIRAIYGMTGAESIPAFEKAIEQLGNDTSEDYWKSTEGNAKKALCGLLAFAKLRPDGVWSGD